MISKYTLEVYKKENKPVFVVTISCPILACIKFFHTLKEANDYTDAEYNRLCDFGYKLRYDMDGVTDEKILKAINEVITNENFIIGENGNTYYKTTEV